jgi:hypothetical protein
VRSRDLLAAIAIKDRAGASRITRTHPAIPPVVSP